MLQRKKQITKITKKITPRTPKIIEETKIQFFKQIIDQTPRIQLEQNIAPPKLSKNVHLVIGLQSVEQLSLPHALTC